MRKILLIAVVALWATSAAAQTEDNMLRGMRQFDLIVESLETNEDAKRCGLSHQDLRDAVVTSTQYAPFRWNRSAEAIVYVNPSVLSVDANQCIYHIDIQVAALETVRLSQSRRTLDGFVELWTGSTLGFEPQRVFAQRVREEVKNLVERFMKDWNLDNR